MDKNQDTIIIKQISTPYIKIKTTLRIFLPKEYFDNEIDRYRVLYLHDGQNLFEPALSLSGKAWNVDKTLRSSINSKSICPLIIVGIDNKGIYRPDEYSPYITDIYLDPKLNRYPGGLGDKYCDFIVNGIKPFIDNNYRTLKDFLHTYIAGASLGGFISAYIGAKYPNVFSILGIFSLASFFKKDAFETYIKQSNLNQNQKYFIYVGGNEGTRSYPNFKQIYLNCSNDFHQILTKQNIYSKLVIDENGKHSEEWWDKYFSDFLLFIEQTVSNKSI